MIDGGAKWNSTSFSVVKWQAKLRSLANSDIKSETWVSRWSPTTHRSLMIEMYHQSEQGTIPTPGVYCLTCYEKDSIQLARLSCKRSSNNLAGKTLSTMTYWHKGHPETKVMTKIHRPTLNGRMITAGVRIWHFRSRERRSRFQNDLVQYPNRYRIGLLMLKAAECLYLVSR